MMRSYRVPRQPLSEKENEVLTWLRLGGGIWSSSQLAGVSVTEIERWLTDGTHQRFASEAARYLGSNGQHPSSGNIVGGDHGPNGEGDEPKLWSWWDL